MQKKVLVSGCFDLLHSGHIAFLKSAASYGDLYVCIGSDKTVYHLKGRYPVITQDERKYMIESLACVKECKINKGNGILDFLEELEEIKPNVFVVNEDGNTPNKIELCKTK
ncbi:MAG: cytidyltransferase, partial [Chitinophagia bacterium]|nr:cytidyltransferase [Chitinophagia bacterium]